MNTVSQETFEALKLLYSRGASTREAMRETGVGRHTALRYQRLYNHREPPKMPTRVGLGKASTNDQCRRTPQPERRALWEKVEGPVPDGMRLGSKCRMAYCGYLEHMCLVEDGSAYRNKWKDLVDASKLSELAVGAFFEFSRPATDELMNKLRATIAQSCTCPYAIRTQKDRATVRLYRLAEGWTVGARDEEMERRALYIPAPCGGVSLTPEEIERRELVLEQRRIERKAMIYTRRMRRGSHNIWMGQFILSPFDEEFLAKPRKRTCSERGCVFPRNGGDKCAYHAHYFDFKWSMEWRSVGREDFISTEDSPFPLLSIVKQWEEPRAAEFTHFYHKGIRDKGWQLSEDWWQENVAKYANELPQPSVHVRVTREQTPQYAPETKPPLALQASPSMRHMGHGKGRGSSKTTAGRHRSIARQGKGSRHSTKEKRWSREELELEANRLLGEEMEPDIYMDDDIGYGALVDDADHEQVRLRAGTR